MHYFSPERPRTNSQPCWLPFPHLALPLLSVFPKEEGWRVQALFPVSTQDWVFHYLHVDLSAVDLTGFFLLWKEDPERCAEIFFDFHPSSSPLSSSVQVSTTISAKELGF